MAPIEENTARVLLPDVANDARPVHAGTLDWVGMGDIEVPVLLAGEDGVPVRTPARVAAYVNLKDPAARGIHMSRLYLQVDRHLSAEPLTPSSLRRLLRDFLDSHQGLSDRAFVQVGFDHMLRRRALKSDNSGWRAYPVSITGRMEGGQLALELSVDVTYSSTCPCSAALARQLVQQRFAEDFAEGATLDRDAVLAWLGSEQGIHATPHSQRSTARLRVRLAPSFADFPIVDLIDRAEEALGTAVQTAVKRVDEQAFAALNGSNLMFCEDAARRLQAALQQESRISDFHIRVAHHESLHPHDAVAVATKGVAGGYTAAG